MEIATYIAIPRMIDMDRYKRFVTGNRCLARDRLIIMIMVFITGKKSILKKFWTWHCVILRIQKIK